MTETEEQLLEQLDTVVPKKEYHLGCVIFLCPQCSKSKIIRSYHEREIATKYRCSLCGFEGPN